MPIHAHLSHLHNTDGVGTHHFELLFPLCSGKGYSSRASGLNQSDLLLSGSSVGQLAIGGGGGGVYLPDYSVRQLTDLQVLKVTKINPHPTYVELCELVFLHIQHKVYLNIFPLKKWRGGNDCIIPRSLRLILEFQNRQTLPVLQPLPLICPNPKFLTEHRHPASRSPLRSPSLL